MKPTFLDPFRIARYTFGLWLNLAFGKAEHSDYVSRTTVPKDTP